MAVYVVLCNDKVDAVFDNMPGAELHANNLRRKWNIVHIIPKMLLSAPPTVDMEE